MRYNGRMELREAGRFVKLRGDILRNSSNYLMNRLKQLTHREAVARDAAIGETSRETRRGIQNWPLSRFQSEAAGVRQSAMDLLNLLDDPVIRNHVEWSQLYGAVKRMDKHLYTGGGRTGSGSCGATTYNWRPRPRWRPRRCCVQYNRFNRGKLSLDF